MTVGEPIRAEISAFFSYAHGDDDDFGIVSAFYRKFKESLESKGRRDIVPFLDSADLEQYGPLDQTLRDKIDRASILFIFLGRCYAQSKYCLKEWEWFRGRHMNDFKSRIFIIELHSDALGMVKNADQRALLESNKRIDWYERTARGEIEPVTPMLRHVNGAAVDNRDFRLKVEGVAEHFLTAHGRIGNSPPDPSGADVIIGLATPDIEPAVEQLRQGLKASLRIEAVSLQEYAMGRDAYEPGLRTAKLVVLPFSWHAVFFSDGPEGGHLAAQQACVAERSKILWWRPPSGVALEGPVDPRQRRESSRRHLDYLGARADEASQAAPEALAEEIRRRLRLTPPPSSVRRPQIALELRSRYADHTARLQDFLEKLWREKYGEPVPDIQAGALLQPTEDFAPLAKAVDGILLATVDKPSPTVFAQVMILKRALLQDEPPPSWGLFGFRPPADRKNELMPPPPCNVLLAAEAAEAGLELRAEAAEMAELVRFLDQVRSVAESRRPNGAAAGPE